MRGRKSGLDVTRETEKKRAYPDVLHQLVMNVKRKGS